MYGALFAAVSETLLELGQTRLEARIGATLVLHTWTRDLRLHPHIHAIVTAGGLALDGSRFVPSEKKYLFPIRVMGKLLRGKMLAALSNAYATGKLAHVPAFHDPSAFPALVATVAELNWNVYAKAPFATTKHVVAYLGRYTHRVGIANSRLLEVSPDRVVFHTRGNAVATLTPLAFLARFIQHVLPSRFHKIRHIGLYASKTKLEDARKKLGGAPAPAPKLRTVAQMIFDLTGTDIRLCPQCGTTLVTRKLPRLALLSHRRGEAMRFTAHSLAGMLRVLIADESVGIQRSSSKIRTARRCSASSVGGSMAVGGRPRPRGAVRTSVARIAPSDCIVA